MIELHITATMKSYSPRAQWQRYESETHRFAGMKAARDYLRTRYGKAKRTPMYRDMTTGTKQTGYVIGFRAADWSHYPVVKWLQQDWIEFRESTPVEVGQTEKRTVHNA